MDRHGNLQLLAHLGRWRSSYSLEHYLQETIAFLVNTSITEEAEGRVLAMAALWEVFRAPPRKSWVQLMSRSKQLVSTERAIRKVLEAEGIDY